MRFDPAIHSYEAVQEYERSQQLFGRLGLLVMFYALADIAVLEYWPGLIALICIVVSAGLLLIMLCYSVRQMGRAKRRVQAEKRQWMVQQIYASRRD
jgi:uncharacterized membrane protein